MRAVSRALMPASGFLSGPGSSWAVRAGGRAAQRPDARESHASCLRSSASGLASRSGRSGSRSQPHWWPRRCWRRVRGNVCTGRRRRSAAGSAAHLSPSSPTTARTARCWASAWARSPRRARSRRASHRSARPRRSRRSGRCSTRRSCVRRAPSGAARRARLRALRRQLARRRGPLVPAPPRRAGAEREHVGGGPRRSRARHRARFSRRGPHGQARHGQRLVRGAAGAPASAAHAGRLAMN
jgi:hypothetical protein